jgi:hypothetical protein
MLLGADGCARDRWPPQKNTSFIYCPTAVICPRATHSLPQGLPTHATALADRARDWPQVTCPLGLVQIHGKMPLIMLLFGVHRAADHSNR